MKYQLLYRDHGLRKWKVRWKAYSPLFEERIWYYRTFLTRERAERFIERRTPKPKPEWQRVE